VTKAVPERKYKPVKEGIFFYCISA